VNQPLPDAGPPAPGGDPAVRPAAETDGADLAPAEPGRAGFRLAYVPGATPGKWAAVWRERLPDVELELVQVEAADVASVLESGEADAALGRLPADKEVFSAIPLYEETAVVCVSRDHLLAALADDETVSSADIAEDTVWVPADDVLFATHPVPGVPPADPDGNPLDPVPTTADVVATVAANVGVAVLPMSLARLHRRKDVTYRILSDGPTAPVGLVWPTERTTDLVEELIGIVRGRTVNSSRGRGAPARGAAEPAADDAAQRRAQGRATGQGKAGTPGRAGAQGGAKRPVKGGAARRGGAPRGRGPSKGKKKGKGR
jgi:DNA-binding transcriptional LysR family regulator